MLSSVAEILNELPQRVDLNLTPAEPVLTANNSADGREVLATITTNPVSPETGANYLRLATSNASFRDLGVRPGDELRMYYISSDAEEIERGIEEKSFIKIPIRRQDVQDPDNALILGASLNGEVTLPERIEIWRYSDQRMEDIAAALDRYEAIRDPPVGWEPSADQGALGELVERANLWLRSVDGPDESWRPARLLATLPDDVRGAKGVADALDESNLAGTAFRKYEGRLLQQAVWMRDIADWARGAALTDVDAAVALFAWTVRNIQLDDEEAARTIHFPWQALVYGHGNAKHRAWVFAELCRQLGIPVVMLGFSPAADEPIARELPAAFVEGQLYLFDAEYGLPLMSGGAPATLKDVSTQPELLQQLDLPDAPYPLDADALQHVTAQIIASPLQLTWRAAELENALEGAQIVALAAKVAQLEDRLQTLEGVDAVALWPGAMSGLATSHATTPKTRLAEVIQFAPFAQLPELWKARVLHFQGMKEVPRERRGDPLAQPKDGHREAVGLYQHPRVRAADAQLDRIVADKRTMLTAAKQSASYWLGLLSFDRENLKAARWWLGEQSLNEYPEGMWAPGARYNLAVVRHAQAQQQGDPPLAAEAVTLLQEMSPESPMYRGSQILARRWQDEAKPVDGAAAAAALESAPGEGKPDEGEPGGEDEAAAESDTGDRTRETEPGTADD